MSLFERACQERNRILDRISKGTNSRRLLDDNDIAYVIDVLAEEIAMLKTATQEECDLLRGAINLK